MRGIWRSFGAWNGLRTVVYGFETVQKSENDRQTKNSFTVQKTGKNVWWSGRKCPSNRKKTRATVDLVCSGESVINKNF